MSRPALVVLAHGTSDAAGDFTWREVVALVRERLGPGAPQTVDLAYADVGSPMLADVLAHIDRSERPIVVPAFLASGYHVRTDVPAQLTAAGRGDAVVTAALGPDRALIDVAADRLREAGYRNGDRVVLASAGSSDPGARDEVRRAGVLLSEVLGRTVVVGAVTGEPGLGAAVAALRESGPGRVAVATWLLAPGQFARVAAAAGDLAGAPLGAHPGVADTIGRRYRDTVEPPPVD